MKETIESKVRKANLKGVPIIALSTPDNGDTLRKIISVFQDEVTAIVTWDIMRGIRGVNSAGWEFTSKKIEEGYGKGNPLQAIEVAESMPELSVLIALNFNNYICSTGNPDPRVIQSLQNVRDNLSQSGTSLVMLGNEFDDMVDEISGDVIRYDESPPGRDEIEEALMSLYDDIEDGIKDQREDADFELTRPSGAEREGLVSAALGLPKTFMVEQAMSLSVTKEGQVNEASLWKYKDAMLNSVSGLSVYRSKESFADLGGLDVAKEHFRNMVGGRGRPSAFFWIDEPEKSGLTSTEDTSGVNKDQLGTALKLMEDFNWRGIVFLGLPGVAKSQFCKCLNGEFGIPVLAGDLGACKHELVGRSERNIRKMFNTVHRVGDENVVVILTANSIEALDDALKSRFPKMYYFDLPSASEKAVIWDIQCKRYDINREQVSAVNDDGWSGRNIKNCCRDAWESERQLSESCIEIVPEAVNSRQKIEKIRGYANLTMLSASYPGLYDSRRSSQEAEGRSISFDN